MPQLHSQAHQDREAKIPLEPHVQPFGMADCPYAFMDAICVPNSSMLSDTISPGCACANVGHRGYFSL